MDCAFCENHCSRLSWVCDVHRFTQSGGMPRLVVGICGRARHGKDQLALTIQRRLSERGVRCFSGSISQVVLREANALGRVSATSREECTPKDIAELVALGHEMRESCEDYWIKALSRQVWAEAYGVALVPGIRFPNETAWIKQAGGLLVRVTRYNEDGSTYISRDRDPNDPMETVLNRLVPDFEIGVKTGQEEWRNWQGISLADYLSGLDRRL